MIHDVSLHAICHFCAFSTLQLQSLQCTKGRESVSTSTIPVSLATHIHLPCLSINSVMAFSNMRSVLREQKHVKLLVWLSFHHYLLNLLEAYILAKQSIVQQISSKKLHFYSRYFDSFWRMNCGRKTPLKLQPNSPINICVNDILAISASRSYVAYLAMVGLRKLSGVIYAAVWLLAFQPPNIMFYLQIH